jgi:hypothetical protein
MLQISKYLVTQGLIAALESGANRLRYGNCRPEELMHALEGVAGNTINQSFTTCLTVDRGA